MLGTHVSEWQAGESPPFVQPFVIRAQRAAGNVAGAELLETNAFGANALALDPPCEPTALRSLNAAAARLALEIAGPRAWVAGAIGPVGLTPQDDGWDEACARGLS